MIEIVRIWLGGLTEGLCLRVVIIVYRGCRIRWTLATFWFGAIIREFDFLIHHIVSLGVSSSEIIEVYACMLADLYDQVTLL